MLSLINTNAHGSPLGINDSTFQYDDTSFVIGAKKELKIVFCRLDPCFGYSTSILDSLADFLKSQPDLIIEIGVHTDVRGAEDYNDSLSSFWAEGIKEYLIRNSVNKDQITAKGYGEREPVLTYDAILKEENQEKRQEMYARNRRTIITIIRI